MIDVAALQSRAHTTFDAAQASIVELRDHLQSLSHDDILALPEADQQIVYGMRHAIEDCGVTISRGVRFAVQARE